MILLTSTLIYDYDAIVNIRYHWYTLEVVRSFLRKLNILRYLFILRIFCYQKIQSLVRFPLFRGLWLYLIPVLSHALLSHTSPNGTKDFMKTLLVMIIIVTWKDNSIQKKSDLWSLQSTYYSFMFYFVKAIKPPGNFKRK